MKKYKLPVFLLVALVIIGAIFLILKHTVFKPQPVEPVKLEQSFSVFEVKKHNFSVKYPSDASKVSLSDQDIKDNYIMRVIQNNDPGYLMTIRLESGLRLPSELSHVEVIDLVTDGALHSLPLEYPKFNLISNKKINVANASARQLDFSYTNKVGITMEQTIVLVALDQDSATYVSMQSQKKDYEKLDKQIFTPIISSIKSDGTSK